MQTLNLSEYFDDDYDLKVKLKDNWLNKMNKDLSDNCSSDDSDIYEPNKDEFKVYEHRKTILNA